MANKTTIQDEDDPQMLPHTRLLIVKDNENIGINFWWYIAKDRKDQLHNKRHRINIFRIKHYA